MKSKYSIIIQWSDEDEVFVVSLSEFGPYAHTHGATYREVFKNALQVLELLIDSSKEEGEALPKPWKYGEKRPEREKKRVVKKR